MGFIGNAHTYVRTQVMVRISGSPYRALPSTNLGDLLSSCMPHAAGVSSFSLHVVSSIPQLHAWFGLWAQSHAHDYRTALINNIVYICNVWQIFHFNYMHAPLINALHCQTVTIRTGRYGVFPAVN